MSWYEAISPDAFSIWFYSLIYVLCVGWGGDRWVDQKMNDYSNDHNFAFRWKSYSNGFYINGDITGKKYGDFNTPNYILSNSGFEEASFSIDFGRDQINKGWNVKYSNYSIEPGILKASHIGNIQDLFYALNSKQPTIINDFTYTVEAPKQQAKHQKILFKYLWLKPIDFS